MNLLSTIKGRLLAGFGITLALMLAAGLIAGYGLVSAGSRSQALATDMRLQQQTMQLQQKQLAQDYAAKQAEMQAQIDELTHVGALAKQQAVIDLKTAQLKLQDQEQALQLEAALLKIQAAAQAAEQIITDAEAEAVKSGDGAKLEVAQAANDQIVAAIQQFTAIIGAHTQQLMAPKQIVRDDSGRAVGIQPVPQQPQ